MWLNNGVTLILDFLSSSEWRNMPFTAATPPRLLMKSDLSGEKAKAWHEPGTGDDCSSPFIFLSSSSVLLLLWLKPFSASVGRNYNKPVCTSVEVIPQTGKSQSGIFLCLYELRLLEFVWKMNFFLTLLLYLTSWPDNLVHIITSAMENIAAWATFKSEVDFVHLN